MSRLAATLLTLLLAAPATAVCTGDCDGDGVVRINELVSAVGIALGQIALNACPTADVNGDGEVTIAELITATNNGLLTGCPAEPTSTPTPSPTDTPTPSPTATVNQPPALASPFVYRGVVDEAIARPIGAVDPEGGAVACSAAALLAGMTLGDDNVLRWTPAADQLGLVDVPVHCRDAGEPPLTTDADLAFRIAPQDPCLTPVCDPATGCSATTADVGVSCCGGSERPRLPEAAVYCPSGRLLQIGRNTDGFGPLQSCDHLRFRQSLQTSAFVPFHIRVSCVNPLTYVTVRATLESAVRGVLVDAQTRVLLPTEPSDGFYEVRRFNFPFSQSGPFLDIEETEANFTVSVRDSDGVEVSKTVRVLVTSDALLPDLPDP